jgi:hypothetical protein
MPRDPLPQSGWKVLGIDMNSVDQNVIAVTASLSVAL